MQPLLLPAHTELRRSGSISRPPGRAGLAPAAPLGAAGSRGCCHRALGDMRVPLPALEKEHAGAIAVAAEQGDADRSVRRGGDS